MDCLFGIWLKVISLINYLTAWYRYGSEMWGNNGNHTSHRSQVCIKCHFTYLWCVVANSDLLLGNGPGQERGESMVFFYRNRNACNQHLPIRTE